MPKKPRKIRLGSKAWSAQIARDKARHAQEQEQEKEKKQKKQWKQKQQKKWQESSKSPAISSERLKSLGALGLFPAASEAEIKKAYRQLSLHYHPDKNPLPSALEKMKAINNAFEYLTGKNED